MRAGAWWAAILLIAAAAARGDAQVLRAVVVEAGSGRPVVGALVTLESERGTVIARQLANDLGRVAFTLETSGRFRLAVARIGHQGTKTDLVSVDRDQTVDLRVEMPVAPVQLPELVAVSRERPSCGAPTESGAAAATIWSEVSKALWGIELSNADAAPIESIAYQRRLSAQGAVIEATTTDWRPADRRPFAAASPDRLVADGFVTVTDSGRRFFAPDAGVLLSDQFAAHYCFAAIRHPKDTGLIGLSFEPARSVRVAGVTGVLWIDRSAAALRELEFRFVNASVSDPGRRTGGRMDFSRVGGEWIVNRWRMTVPIIATYTANAGIAGISGKRDSTIGYLERGGEARLVGTGSAGLAIEGTVFDSVSNRPFVGAVVTAAGATPAMTDEQGRFRLALAAPGSYVVTVRHDLLRRYGLTELLASVSVARTGIASVRVVTPSPRSLVGTLCPGSDDPDGRLGVVLVDAAGADAAEISFTGPATANLGGRYVVDEAGTWRRVRIDATGVARICGVPMSGEQAIRLVTGGRRAGLRAIAPRLSAVTVVDLPR